MIAEDISSNWTSSADIFSGGSRSRTRIYEGYKPWIDVLV